jgi:hypothetical protein
MTPAGESGRRHVAGERTEGEIAMNFRPEHLMEHHGKRFVVYASLLDPARSHGLRAIRAMLLQEPTETNG